MVGALLAQKIFLVGLTLFASGCYSQKVRLRLESEFGRWNVQPAAGGPITPTTHASCP